MTGHQLGHHPDWQDNHESELLETSLPDDCAAGDEGTGSTKQAAFTSGEEAIVAILIRNYLNRT